DAAREILRERRFHPEGVDREKGLGLQRQIFATPLRQSVAPADATAASAGLDSGRRQRRDLGLVRKARLSLCLFLLFRIASGTSWARRLLASGRARRQGAEPLSR